MASTSFMAFRVATEELRSHGTARGMQPSARTWLATRGSWTHSSERAWAAVVAARSPRKLVSVSNLVTVQVLQLQELRRRVPLTSSM